MNSKTRTNRHTVGEIARLAGCSEYHVRRFADSGHLISIKDFNGWRVFPNPDQAVANLRQLLAISFKTDKEENSDEQI